MPTTDRKRRPGRRVGAPFTRTPQTGQSEVISPHPAPGARHSGALGDRSRPHSQLRRASSANTDLMFSSSGDFESQANSYGSTILHCNIMYRNVSSGKGCNGQSCIFRDEGSCVSHALQVRSAGGGEAPARRHAGLGAGPPAVGPAVGSIANGPSRVIRCRRLSIQAS